MPRVPTHFLISMNIQDPAPRSERVESTDSDGFAAQAGKVAGRVTRRVFNRVASVFGIGLLADGISGGKISGMFLEGDHGENHQEPDLAHEVGQESEKLEEIAKNVAADLEKDMEGLDDREKALKIVDYLGTAVFAWGIKDLMPDLFKSGHGHVHAAHYGAMAALTGLKAQLSDEEGRHHLKEEWVSTAKAFGIISGTIVIAEGLKMDLMEAYKKASGNSIGRADKIALMNMFATTLSPVATTVGSASIIRKISNDFADGDPKVMATCVSHISNLSGYLLFGDPPFIAVCEKYGFAEGIKWQCSTMWPLALTSLYTSTLKLNLFMAQKDGLKGKGAFQVAMSNTNAGLLRNVPYLARITTKSLANVIRYYTGMKQDVGGLEVKIGEVITSKFANLARLPFASSFDDHGHEIHKGMITDVPAVRVGNDLIASIVERAAGTVDENCEEEDQRSNLRKAIDSADWDEVILLGNELDVPNITIIVDQLKDLHDNARIDDSTIPSDIPSNPLRFLNVKKMYERSTDVKRIQTAMGHNLGDVIDVFPFQAGSVPFLLTAFKDAVSSMEAMGLDESEREIVTFFMIMIFSMFADNYVGCKIGLELYPEKPQIALIAAIQGGSHTAIGNMANIAQFDLNTFSLKDSFKQFGWHIDNITAGLLWSRALGIIQKTGIIDVPDVAKKSEPH